MTQQIYTTPTPFSGKDVTIENSGKGYTSNMLIKGQTYQNLFKPSRIMSGNSYSIEDNILVLNANGTWARKVYCDTNMFKKSTKYTIIVNVIANTLVSTNPDLGVSLYLYDLTGIGSDSISFEAGKIKKEKRVFTTKSDTINSTDLLIEPVVQATEGTFRCQIVILEGDWTNKEVPTEITEIESAGEKENNKISILSEGKNLCPINKFSTKQARYVITKTPIPLKPNTYYSMSSNRQLNVLVTNTLIDPVPDNWNQDVLYSQIVSNNKGYEYGASAQCQISFLNKNWKYAYITTWIMNDNGADVENLMFCEGQNYFTYEPHKENRKEILLPIEGGLKSLPNGVCDTIEQRENGVYLVQRVGFIKLQGNENWSLISIDTGVNTKYFFTSINNLKKGCESGLTNLYGVYTKRYGENVNNTEEQGIALYVDNSLEYGNLRLRVSNDKLSTKDVEGLKTWLQSNPLTVYYELATPIETKLDVDTVNLETFKNLTYVSSGNSIKPTLSFKAPILGYKTINPIQLKTTQDGTEVNVYPYSTPELITFGDNETLADKINNLGNTHKHNNATVTTDGFMSKESYSKLESLTNYTHPSTHAATMITEDSTHRFITDTERNNWNAKASTNIATPSTNGLMSNTDKQKIDRISNNFDIVYDANTETIRFRFR